MIDIINELMVVVVVFGFKGGFLNEWGEVEYV